MIGIIGGTGLSDLAKFRVVDQKTPETPYGTPSAPIDIGTMGDHSVAFLARHGRPHAIAPHCVNYQANLCALKSIGVDQIIAVNAVGGIHKGAGPGAIIVPDQIIDYTWGRAHTFGSGLNGESLLHVDFTHPYHPKLREQLIETRPQNSEVLQHGCMAVTQGPRLESAAEIKKLELDGCDIVGMTAMPEAALAKELDIPYASLALSVNWAAGLTEQEITMADIEAVLNMGMSRVADWLTRYVVRFGA